MGNENGFCTCTDLECPFHPSNHDKGCMPCIAKNRKEREIPSCFFNMLSTESKPSDYSFEGFAELVRSAAARGKFAPAIASEDKEPKGAI